VAACCQPVILQQTKSVRKIKYIKSHLSELKEIAVNKVEIVPGVLIQ